MGNTTATDEYKAPLSAGAVFRQPSASQKEADRELMDHADQAWRRAAHDSIQRILAKGYGPFLPPGVFARCGSSRIRLAGSKRS